MIDEMQLVEGETRYQIAWHYKIPYPRLHNLPTGTITDSPQRISKPTYEVCSTPFFANVTSHSRSYCKKAGVFFVVFGFHSSDMMEIGKTRVLF
jgi:hypothetical protein